MNITPRRFESKARDADLYYSIDITNYIDATERLDTVQWFSRPHGLQFTDATIIPNVNGEVGKVARVKIGGGAEGQIYRVAFLGVLFNSGEVVVPTVDNDVGVPLQVVGDPVSNQPNYRWYGNR